jgi:hypothetical protein
MFHRLPVGLAAHDDGDEFRGGHGDLGAAAKKEGSLLDEGAGPRKRRGDAL